MNRHQKIADEILIDAQKWIDNRSKKFKLSEKLVASWRENPTAYQYTFLWTAKNLHYWKRDYNKVIKKILSPCI